MIGTRYLTQVDRLLERNRLVGIALGVMLVFNLWNWSALTRAQKASRVTLVPLAGGTGMWVGNGQASPEYLRSMARYITGQLGNYTAGTTRNQLAELLQLFPPESVGQAQTEFLHIADDRERFPSIASRVIWGGDEPLKVVDNNMMQVTTLKSQLVNGNTTKSEQIFYCIHYRIDDTQFRLLSVEELGGQGDNLCINKAKNAATDPAGATSR